MSKIVSVNPFRCKVWDLHDRIEHLISEDTCRVEISSFSQHGQLVPALGRPLRGDPDYDVELICGARRLFVARHLNSNLLVEMREMTDRAAVIARDIENRQRQDISPYERGLSFARCLRAGYFETQEDLAKALKISQSQVSRLLTLARLPSVVVNAFGNPLEMREGWGTELMAALQDNKDRNATIARARSLACQSPRPSAIEVYQQLVAAPVVGRKVRSSLHDEVVTDVDGSPLFRIRTREKAIAVLLPRDEVSQETLNAVRDAVREVLRSRERHVTAAKTLPNKVPSGRGNFLGAQHDLAAAASSTAQAE